MQLLSLLVLVMTMMAARAYHFEITTDETSFLQVGYKQVDSKVHDDSHDLVMMHVPYNFGHTIETKAGGENWAGANPNLQTISNITGCPMYMTPQKYWPTELAKTYFGNKKVFGVLRDPYERLVQLFKSGMEGYSHRDATALAKCDVNSAVRKMMNETMHGNVFRDGCVFLPQAEYFEGPHRITVPVDSREFPMSMNGLFEDHNYSNMNVDIADVIAEPHCRDTVWGNKDLDCETRKMVKDFYSRDFELICKHFNLCEKENTVCTAHVPGMCPEGIKTDDSPTKTCFAEVKTPDSDKWVE